MDNTTRGTLSTLATLLENRLRIIGDHAWRDRDQPGHLAALKTVAVEIEAVKKQVPADLDRELAHYLERCSFDKALVRIQDHLK
jgi:hypothetical protein